MNLRRICGARLKILMVNDENSTLEYRLMYRQTLLITTGLLPAALMHSFLCFTSLIGNIAYWLTEDTVFSRIIVVSKYFFNILETNISHLKILKNLFFFMF